MYLEGKKNVKINLKLEPSYDAQFMLFTSGLPEKKKSVENEANHKLKLK